MIFYKFLVVVLIFAFPGLLQSQNVDNKFVLHLKNPLKVARTDEPIVINRSFLQTLVNNIPTNQAILLTDAKNNPIPSQLDDRDGDGTWDELAFLYDFKPKEKVRISLQFVDLQAIPNFPKRAHAYLGYRPERKGDFKPVTANTRPADHKPQSQPYLYQFEGPGWESDRVAYRSYFDSRNGKDIFGKTTREMVLESIGTGEDYHKLQPWGMDVLKVNNSLGAGALALRKNGQLHRLGETGGATFKLIADGPVRAIIQLNYTDWQVAENQYNIVEEITIWGGKRWYQSEVKLSGTAGRDTLVTGIVNLNNHPVAQPETKSDFYIMATHAAQSENKDVLGMAIFVPRAIFAGTKNAPAQGKGITQTSYVEMVPGKDGQYRYYFYTGWELEHQDFKNKADFITALQNEVNLLSNKIKITK